MSTLIPDILHAIPHPPEKLYITGVDTADITNRPRVAIVGARKVTPYGKNVTTKLAGELAAQGIVIVSGLALGVDTLAHTAALEAGGLTVAVLPTGLDNIYPRSHRQLAKRIEKQGILLTEYPPGTRSFPGNFVARNRLVSGLSDAVLIIEAAEKSGTLHTARFAIEQGRKVLAVPGNITSPMSAGTNQLIKAGAIPATCTTDILDVLGILPGEKERKRPTSPEPNEQAILDLLYGGVTDGTALLLGSKLNPQIFSQTLTMLEISGSIKSLGNNQWTLL
jgi:DNA processing protein